MVVDVSMFIKVIQGEETGDIFSDTGATLSAANITVPTAGNYTHVAAIFDKDFKVGSHHMVYNLNNPATPINDKRYVSTASGGAIEGTASDVEMMTGTFNTFMPQIACSNDAGTVERVATTEIVVLTQIFLQVARLFLEESSNPTIHLQQRMLAT